MNSMRPYLERMADIAESVLYSHKAGCQITGGTCGPQIIRFHLQPLPHVRFSQVKALQDDLAIAMSIPQVKLSKGNEGLILEIPNPNPQPLNFLEYLGDKTLKPFTCLLGSQIDGTPLLANITSPEVAHCLISGTTGSGKSTLLRSIVASLLLFNRPSSLSVIVIDPKGRTFPSGFSTKHFIQPVVVDKEIVLQTLQSLVSLMEKRDRERSNTPRIIVAIDELSDLVMTVDGASDLLTRLLQRGREAGLHVLAATQRPSASILSGLMRANFPLRLVGKVVSPEDSRIAAGRGGIGAERLRGKGDFIAVTDDPVRFQVPFLGVRELQDATQNLQGQSMIALPQVETQPKELEVDSIAVLAEKLRPFWIANGAKYGSKTAALRFLFGNDAPTGGYYWQQTQLAIAQIEENTSSS